MKPRGKDGGTLGRTERLPVCSFIFLGMGRKLLFKEPHLLTTIRARLHRPRWELYDENKGLYNWRWGVGGPDGSRAVWARAKASAEQEHGGVELFRVAEICC